jgi:hypothetical protein
MVFGKFFSKLFGKKPSKLELAFDRLEAAKERLNEVKENFEKYVNSIGNDDEKEVFEKKMVDLKSLIKRLDLILVKIEKRQELKDESSDNYASKIINEWSINQQKSIDENWNTFVKNSPVGVYPEIDGRKEHIQVFFRKDLTKIGANKLIKDLDYYDLYLSSIKTVQIIPFVIFIDDNGDTKLLKNRYGKKGIIN